MKGTTAKLQVVLDLLNSKCDSNAIFRLLPRGGRENRLCKQFLAIAVQPLSRFLNFSEPWSPCR